MMTQDCIEKIRHKNITVKENGKRVNFINDDEHEFLKIKVDDCLVKSGIRSDWIVTKIDVGSVIIELKGKDIQHACEQLKATETHPSCTPFIESKRAMLVICSKYPSYDSSIAKSEEAARKKGIRLKISCRNRDYKIEEILGIKKD